MRTLPLAITILLVAALVLAQEVTVAPESFNHPTNCIQCHGSFYGTSGWSVTFLTSGSGTCDPSQAECVWNHDVIRGTEVWKQCKNCHSALHGILSSSSNVHSSLYGTYGCACHAVAHVGYGDSVNGFTACIYLYVPKLSDNPTYFGAKPLLSFQSVPICFKGTPGGTYTFDTGLQSTVQSLYNVLTSNGKVYMVALNVGYTKYPNGTIIARGMGASLFVEDFFTGMREGANIFRYEWGTAYGAVLKNPNVRTHPLTEEAPNGETIIMGVFDIHNGQFILVTPYAPYSRAPYYLPVAKNPGVAACFNCHFVYSGQTGTAKVMQVGGIWKIGIPADVLNSLTNPHEIVAPASQAAGGAAPNLALVALIATGTLLAGGFVALKRRL
ncbi:hypothetical protein [Pyrobaculum sp.]|uniref:hypothetical protein n=1 Tax=Pyrobaculum sp. TaxID=2004705 RepID=UPI00317D3FFF